MLSAIAARKARQAAQTTEQKLGIFQPCSLSPSPSPVETPSPTPSLKPASKRKTNSVSVSERKKRKKDASRSGKRTVPEGGRYFARDVALREEDVIILDPEPDPSPMEELSDAAEISVTQPVVIRGKRIWSPSRPLQDSSDEEGASSAEEESAMPGVPVPKPPNAKVGQQPPILSMFHPVLNQNSFTLTSSEEHSLSLLPTSTEDGSTLLLIPIDQTLCLIGTYTLTLLRGTVSLSGTTLTPSFTSHRVFAPRCAPLPVLRCLSSDGQVDVDLDSTSRLRLFFEHHGAIVVVQPLETGVGGLGSVCRAFDEMFTTSASSSFAPLDTLGIRIVQYRGRNVCPFDIPDDWENALSTISLISDDEQTANPPVYLVKGAKKTGKSTFARTLVNRLLARYRRVAFLETDLGQSEFTPGGMVALNVIEHCIFGPPFTHPSIPYRAHYIGSTSPRSSPSHYLAAVQDLLQSYRLDVQFDVAPHDIEDNRIADMIPLVVNTMGWTKGLGADLSRKIEEMLGPIHIFAFADPLIPGLIVQEDPVAEPPQNSHSIQPIPPSVLSTAYTAADLRTLSILSYFHAIFPPSPPSVGLSQMTATTWRATLPLCAMTPYELTPALALDRVMLTGAGMEDVVPAEIARVLNAAVVGLVSCEPGTLDAVPTPASGIPYTQGDDPPSPATSTCHGLALVRAIAPPTQVPVMHVLTAVPPRLLASARVLVKGELELPVWGMLDFRDAEGGVAGVERGRVPFLRWGKGEGVGAEKRRVRRNLMRRGQM